MEDVADVVLPGGKDTVSICLITGFESFNGSLYNRVQSSPCDSQSGLHCLANSSAPVRNGFQKLPFAFWPSRSPISVKSVSMTAGTSKWLEQLVVHVTGRHRLAKTLLQLM